MAVVNIAVGGTTGSAPGHTHTRYGELRIKVDMSVSNLAAGNVLRVINIPLGLLPLGIGVKVTTADSVAAATADIGLYKVADDTAVDEDGLINELAIGVLNTASYAAPAAANQITEAMYVGIAQGAGGEGALNDDAVIEIVIPVIDLTFPTEVE